MPKRTESALVAVYRNLSEAEAAAGELTAHAFAEDHIHLVSEHNRAVVSAGSQAPPDAGHMEEDVPTWCAATFGRAEERERHRYESAVRHGKVLLGLDTPEQMLDMAAEILKHHSPVALARHDAAASVETRSRFGGWAQAHSRAEHRTS